MSKYTLEVYDKDNDIYTEIETLDNYELAIEKGKLLGKLIREEMLVNRQVKNREPYDYAQMRNAEKENEVYFIFTGFDN